MTRSRAVWLAVWWLAGAMPLAGQQWDAPEAVALRRAAALRRATETAAPALGWRGTARGQLDWLLDVAPDAAAPVTRRLTTDSLRAEVYGRGGGVSKQIVRDWRRGRALPADIRFHRDHLGIVTDGFGDRIRLGDGDEVRDVPHPLAAGADSVYEVALGDSLAIRGPGGTVRIRELLVRPRDPSAAAAVGALDLDVETAALVRLRLGFTPAALRDRTVESLAIVLEQARVGEGRWLPMRQQLEIRRRSAWADLEVRTIIRGTWTIEAEPDTTVTPDEVRGAPIVGPARPASDRALARVTLPSRGEAAAAADARALVRRLAGARLDDARRGARLRVRGASGIAAFDRVQGLALGIGGAWRPGSVRFEADAGVGISSRLATGGLRAALPIGRGELEFTASRRVRDQSDAPVISGALNSLRALIASDDAGDWVLASEAGVAWRSSRGGATQLRLGAGVREARARAAAATSLSGTFRPNVLPGQPRQVLLTAALASDGASRLRWRLATEAGIGGAADYQRLAVEVGSAVAAGPGTLALTGAGAVLTDGGPAWRAFPLGGRATLPGAPYRAWAGGALMRLEARWLAEVPIPALRLRGPVTTGDRLRIGPYAGIGAVWSPRSGTGRPVSGGPVPVAGVALEPLWGLLRIEIGTSLAGEGAGRLRVVADVHPDWWPLL